MMLLLLFILNVYSSVSVVENKFVNYIDLSFIQSLNIMGGSQYGGGDINSSIGFLYEINRKNNILLNYSLKYNGPSITYDKNNDLKERSINQQVMMEWQKDFDYIKIRPHLYYSYDKRKSSSIGSFDDNIYNNKSKGFGLAFDYIIEKSFLSSYFIYRKIEFPNYTDLITEFKNPDSSYNLNGGLYDNNLYRFGIKFKHDIYFLSTDYTIQKYINQKIVQSDALYSDELEKDKEYEFKLGFEKKYKALDIFPSISYIKHTSNQNFLRFKSFTDLSPVFINDAYDYSEIEFLAPLYTEYKSLDIFLNCGYKIKKYSSRPPRDENNEYIYSKKQTDNILSLTLNISKPINQLAYFLFYFSFINSSSNNKFDYYLPLNYSAYSFGIGYKIKY